MKAKKLKSLINNIPDDADVLFKPSHSDYPEDFTDTEPTEQKIRSFSGDDLKAYIILSDGQKGGL